MANAMFASPRLLAAPGGAVAVALIVGITLWSWFTSGTDDYRVTVCRYGMARQPSLFQVEQGLGAGTNALPHLIRIIGKAPNRGRIFNRDNKKSGTRSLEPSSGLSRMRPVPDSQNREDGLSSPCLYGGYANSRAKTPGAYIGRTEKQWSVRFIWSQP